MTVRDRLIEHIAEMKAGQISKSTVHRLMALLRELLEARNELNKYPLLRMFCDWSLHTKLDRLKVSNQLLDLVDAMFAKRETMDAQLGQLCASISPAKFQKEVASLLEASFIDPSLAYSPRFPQIVRHIIDDLKGKIVSRRPESVKKRTSERLAAGYRFMAARFYFKHENSEYKFVIVFKNISGEMRMKNDEGFLKVGWPI
jgi:hypothetical protein